MGRQYLSPASRVPTAALAATGLIGGYGVAVASGSRPLGGVVLAAFGLICITIWARRDGGRMAAALTAAMLLVFVLSHVLGLLIGGWPAVLVAAGAAGAICWRTSDSEDRLSQTGDRADALRSRSAVPPDQDRLDSRGASPGDVLLQAVPDVDRLPG
jgi:hypothetical protein